MAKPKEQHWHRNKWLLKSLGCVLEDGFYLPEKEGHGADFLTEAKTKILVSV